MAKAVVGKEETETEVAEVEDSRNAAIGLLRLEDVVEDDKINVRPWSGSDDELDAITELSRAIKDVGQIHPVSVRWKQSTEPGTAPLDGQYYLFIGRRRLAALRLLNAEMDKGQEPYLIEAKIYQGLSDDDAYRMAVVENAKRKDANAMDNAQNIAEVRNRNNWNGGKYTKDVAAWFEMSPAWVTTHEKLLGIEKEAQSMVSQGQMSAKAAMDYVKVDEKDRQKVFDAAVKIAGQDQPITAGVLSSAGEKVGVKVTSAHVRKAVRQTDATAVVARTKKDLIEFFMRFDSVEYGYKNGAVRDFVVYLCEKYAAGLGTDRTMTEKFDLMTNTSDPGKPDKEETAERAAEKPTANKPAKKKSAKKKK